MSRNSRDDMAIHQKTLAINEALHALYKNPHTPLTHRNAWELLVSVILSAQCTDERVNRVTATLFQKYRTLADYVRASQEEFERDIFSTGFYRQKAKNILAAARIIEDEFGGEVPGTMNELLELPGVARKTANVMLSEWFKCDEGVVVDTHVRRLALQMGLSRSNNPVVIEQDLMKLVPRKDWRFFSIALVFYGREYCPAKRHEHNCCLLRKFDI